MRVVHLPLDSRPCNVLFPVQLAQWSGHECLIPSPEKMDHFTQEADCQDSRDFLLAKASEADALVVSADHLCYGSLLGSRQDSIAADEALRRLDVLREVRCHHPSLPIHVYSVIMRSSISTLYAGDLNDYQAMTDYSVYSDRAAQTGSAEDAMRAQQARDRLSPGALKRYETARARNHAVNSRCVELAAEGVISSLALLQEDAQCYGFHKGEQRALVRLCREKKAANVYLHNGADEGGALMVMKAILAQAAPQTIAVRCLGWEQAAFVACYEDRPFGENVKDTLACAGLQTDACAQSVLAVCCPPDGVQTDWPKPEHEEGLRQQAEEIAAMVGEGKKVYVLDVTRANGGTPALMQFIHEKMPSLPLAGYSAWNTASNSLGTAVAQMISDLLAGCINRSFFWERMLDDLAYQGIVREPLNEELRSAGEDPFRLADQTAAEKRLCERMKRLTSCEPMFACVPPYRVWLPWNRTFEAEIRVEGEELMKQPDSGAMI